MRPTPLCRIVFLGALILAQAPTKAQQSLQWIDAPRVVFDEYTRMDDLADLDGDGDLDALGWWWNGAGSANVTLKLMKNLGQGDFGAGPICYFPFSNFYGSNTNPTPIQAFDSAVADLDQDGDLDYVVALGHDLRVFRLDGFESSPVLAFSDIVGSGFASPPRASVVAVDFNGDGTTDIVTVLDNQLRLYPNAGNATFSAPSSSLPGDFGKLALIQADADPELEIIVMRNQASLEIYDLAGGTPQLLQSFPAPSNATFRPCVGDVDGDGDEDIVVFMNQAAGGYVLLRCVTIGAYVFELHGAGGPADRLVDVDGDGDLDGVCCGGGSGIPIPPTYNYRPSHFRVSINDGNGQFTVAWEMEGMGASRLAGAADLNGDGDVDLVAGRTVYFAQKSLATPVTSPSLDPLFQVIPQSFWGDIDGDGDVDLVQSQGTVWTHDGANGWTKSNLAVSNPPFGNLPLSGVLAVGDFDGDGRIDVLAKDGSVKLCLGDGNGRFQVNGVAMASSLALAPDVSGTGSAQASVFDSYAADFDGDGDLDFAATNASGLDTRIHWNDGSGHFPTSTDVTDAAVAGTTDFNGDGWLDLVYFDGRLRPGTAAPGQWGPPTNLGIGSVRVFLIDDLDEDGDDDLVVRRLSDLAFLAIENLGGGSVTSHLFPGNGTLPYTVTKGAAVDVTGDGRRDVVLCSPLPIAQVPSSQHAARISVIIPRGPGDLSSWASPQVFVSDARDFVDLDQDGDIDFLGSHAIFNNAVHPAVVGTKRQYGQGSPGSNGFQPRLGARGPFSTGSQASVSVTGGLGGAYMVFAFGLQELSLPDVPAPGLQLYTNGSELSTWLLGGGYAVAGAGALELPYTVPAFLGGYTLFHQAFLFDPGVPGYLTQTQGLRIDYP